MHISYEISSRDFHARPNLRTAGLNFQNAKVQFSNFKTQAKHLGPLLKFRLPGVPRGRGMVICTYHGLKADRAHIREGVS